jgi:hypothetical protein
MMYQQQWHTSCVQHKQRKWARGTQTETERKQWSGGGQQRGMIIKTFPKKQKSWEGNGV